MTVLVFELEPELDDSRWQELSSTAPPDELLLGLYQYLLDYDTYVLDEVFQQYLKTDYLWSLLSDWSDDATLLWERRISQMKCDLGPSLNTVSFHPASRSYALYFGDYLYGQRM